MKKVNYKAIDTISARLSQKLIADNFIKKEFLNGADILSLSPIKQINLFVVKEIFSVWKEEVSKLESPYFDYQHEDVQEAMDVFMKSLSFHIKVKATDLEAILTDAVRDTFLMVFTPFQFLSEEVKNEHFEELKKYYVINAHILEHDYDSFMELRKLAEQGEFELYDDLQFLEELNEVFPVIAEDFIMEEVEQNSPETEVEAEPELVKEEVASDKTEQVEEPETIVEKIPTNSLNDAFAAKPSTLLDELQKSSGKSIKEQIGLNQRFAFTKDLFGNDEGLYAEAIHHLDSFTDYDTASSYLIENFASKYDWEEKEEQASELFEILAKRF